MNTPRDDNYDNLQFVKRSASADPTGGAKTGSWPGGAASAAVSGGRSSKGRFLTKGKGILIIILLAALLFFMSVFAFSHFGGGEGIHSGGTPYVGVLHIEGTIGSGDASYNHSWVLDQIRDMRKDDLNQGILLYVNSPGGSVYQTDEVYQEILKYQKKTKRPVYAYFAEYAASGAYYLSAPSDWIVANRFCTTGSIGVYYGPIVNLSELMEKAGIQGEYIKSGANKAMGNYFDPLTEEQRAIYQAEVDEIYDIFVGIVSEGRNIPEDKVRVIADGRAYTAAQALENGLIDQIGTLQDTKKRMKEAAGTDHFVTVQYVPEQSVWSYFFGMQETFREYTAALGKSDAEKAMDYIHELSQHPYEYMMLLQ